MIAILKQDFSPYYKFSAKTGGWVQIIFKKGEKMHYKKRKVIINKKHSYYVVEVFETKEEYNMDFFNQYFMTISEYRKLKLQKIINNHEI